jgi:hypothetical protein
MNHFLPVHHFDAVAYDGAIYCLECLPPGIDSDSPDVRPVFAGDEFETPPACDVCHKRVDYVTIRQ